MSDSGAPSAGDDEKDEKVRAPNKDEINKMFTLKVDKISQQATDASLREAFSAFGEIGDVYIPRNFHSGSIRGFAFVRFRSEEEGLKAIEGMNGKEIDGATIEVSEAKEKRPENPKAHMQNRGGGGGGGGGGRNDRGRGGYDDRDRDRGGYGGDRGRGGGGDRYGGGGGYSDRGYGGSRGGDYGRGAGGGGDYGGGSYDRGGYDRGGYDRGYGGGYGGAYGGGGGGGGSYDRGGYSRGGGSGGYDRGRSRSRDRGGY